MAILESFVRRYDRCQIKVMPTCESASEGLEILVECEWCMLEVQTWDAGPRRAMRAIVIEFGRFGEGALVP